MLGGGVFVTQNKTLPGSYLNFVNASAASSAVSDRGVVAIALPLNKSAGKVITITRNDFTHECYELLGKEYTSADVAPLREIFCHANKIYIYDLGTDGTVEAAVKAFEPYEFNVLCAYTADAEDTGGDGMRGTDGSPEERCRGAERKASAPDHTGVSRLAQARD